MPLKLLGFCRKEKTRKAEIWIRDLHYIYIPSLSRCVHINIDNYFRVTLSHYAVSNQQELKFEGGPSIHSRDFYELVQLTTYL